ncbi:MAG: hypothetical protein IJD33_02170, partial [Clostridia bacterium]|nr:hypothetical protein [Clostridia bacterium]
ESVLYGMLLETEMAITGKICDRAYGEKLLSLIQIAIAQKPISAVDFSRIEEDAKKARSDKKNTDDGKIKMAVAKALSEWTMYALPFEEYKSALSCAAEKMLPKV